MMELKMEISSAFQQHEGALNSKSKGTEGSWDVPRWQWWSFQFRMVHKFNLVNVVFWCSTLVFSGSFGTFRPVLFITLTILLMVILQRKNGCFNTAKCLARRAGPMQPPKCLVCALVTPHSDFWSKFGRRQNDCRGMGYSQTKNECFPPSNWKVD